MTLVASLYTGEVAGQPLRFFSAPNDWPELPWHSADDLHRCLGLPPAASVHFQRKLKGAWSKDVKTVATATGITTICPHWMAQGLIKAAISMMAVRQAFLAEYTAAGVEAMKAQTQHLPVAERLAFSLAAAKNSINPDEAGAS